MSVASEITKLNSNLISSYEQVQTKGGNIPSAKNFDNLPAAIGSIITGGSPEIEMLEGDTFFVVNNDGSLPAVVASGTQTYAKYGFMYLNTAGSAITNTSSNAFATTTNLAVVRNNTASVIFIGNDFASYHTPTAATAGFFNHSLISIFKRTYSIGDSFYYQADATNSATPLFAFLNANAENCFRKLKYAGNNFLYNAGITQATSPTFTNIIFPELEIAGNAFGGVSSTASYNQFTAADYRKLRIMGSYFLRGGTFSGNDIHLDFDSLKTGSTNMLLSINTNATTGSLFQGTGCKVSFGKDFVLTASHTSFIDRAVANATTFTLEFRAVQTLLTAPTNFLRSLNKMNIDLRIRVGSYGADALNNIWLGFQWKSVTLIDENGNSI